MSGQIIKLVWTEPSGPSRRSAQGLGSAAATVHGSGHRRDDSVWQGFRRFIIVRNRDDSSALCLQVPMYRVLNLLPRVSKLLLIQDTGLSTPTIAKAAKSQV